MRQEGWPVHLERIKRFVHPEGYGFWLDPDGLFTLLGAIIAIAALSVAVDIPNAIRLLGDPVAGRPVVATVVSAAVYLAMARAFASLVRAWTPGDFEATGRFHAWVATFGIVLALGIVVLVSWPLPGYVGRGSAGIAVRIVAIVCYGLAGGVVFRRAVEARNVWVRGRVAKIRRDRG